MHINSNMVFKSLKAASVIPLTYSYIIYYPRFSPILNDMLVKIAMVDIRGLMNLDYIGAILYILGLLLAVKCLVSVASSKPTTYSSSILLLIVSMLWLRIGFRFSDIAIPVVGFMAYLIFDTLAIPFTVKVERKGSLNKRISAKILSSYIPLIVFSASKYVLPIIFGLALYYVIEYALTYQIEASYGVMVFWHFITHEIIGKVLIFLVITGLGVYLLREISETMVYLSIRERQWAKTFISQEKIKYIKEFYGKTGLPHRASITGFSALIFYVLLISILRDFIRYLPIGGFLVSTLFSLALFFILSYISWKIVDKIMFTITTEPTWKTIYALLLITLAFLAYLELRFNYVTVFINTGEPIRLPIDSYAYETYFAFYSELIKIIRFITTVIGVVP